jgi:hypothetical protein
MYYTPDLTGQDPACYKDNDIYAIHKYNQKIFFDVPVFEDSIIIYMLNSLGAVLSTFVKGQDWNVLSDDYDDTSISRMKVYDSEFDKNLLKSITIIRPFANDYQINLTHQRLYPVNVKKALLNGVRLEVTPDLIGGMLEDIEYLSMITRPVSDSHSLSESGPMLFQLDAHKELPENYVEFEEHEVNVLEGRKVIRPIGGAFFKDSVKVRIKDDPSYLVAGIDYIIFRLNVNKTRVTENTSGVYDFILVLREYVGILEVTYHAFGGEATIYDTTELNKKCNNIINYLTDSSFLTSAGLGSAPIILALNDKVTYLEDEMRKLLLGQASYGDVSSGKSILKKIASTDDLLHWYTIATLYKVDGAEDIILADRLHFRIKTLRTNMMFDAMVSVNLTNVNTKLSVDILSEHYEKGFIPYEDYSGINNIVRPQLRILYNDDTQLNSGVVLQFGIEFKGFIEETIVVEDLSGKEGCWKLIDPPTTAVPPEDDLVQLPNEAHIYDVLNSDSTAISTLVPFKCGYIVWAGGYPLNRPEGGFKEYDLEHILPDNIDLSKVTHARLELKESDQLLFPIEINFVPGSEDMTGVATFMYNLDNCYLVLRVWKDTDGIKMRLTSDVDRTNIAAQLDLVHVFLFTN